MFFFVQYEVATIKNYKTHTKKKHITNAGPILCRSRLTNAPKVCSLVPSDVIISRVENRRQKCTIFSLTHPRVELYRPLGFCHFCYLVFSTSSQFSFKQLSTGSILWTHLVARRMHYILNYYYYYYLGLSPSVDLL